MLSSGPSVFPLFVLPFMSFNSISLFPCSFEGSDSEDMSTGKQTRNANRRVQKGQNKASAVPPFHDVLSVEGKSTNSLSVVFRGFPWFS